MAFGGQVDDSVHMVLPHQFLHFVEVADVGLYERVVGLVLNVFQIRQVAGVCQLVEIDDTVVRILVDEQADYMATDESGTAGDENVHVDS